MLSGFVGFGMLCALRAAARGEAVNRYYEARTKGKHKDHAQFTIFKQAYPKAILARSAVYYLILNHNP